jgi:NodT family efflux transporter outer membrane factor (OMF) lipoprotein
MRIRLVILLFPILMAGCVLGPNYKRPSVLLPGQFRSAPPDASDASIADRKWSDLFHDETLNELIATALKQNFDIEMAAERVQEARARFGIARSNQLPSLSAMAQLAASRPSLVGANLVAPNTTSLNTSYTQAGGLLSWELDVWGRLRRLSEAAEAQYLASEEGRRAVVVSLIGDTADSYFTLRERDLELDIARNTEQIAEDNLRLVRLRHDRGAATGLDVHQAEELLYTASAQIARTEDDIAETENAISLLLAKPPGDIPRGKGLNDFHFPEDIPPGIPSSLLERRPDIREAEQTLIAANAQIGAARALYFPQISLTGFMEGQSRALSELLTGPARFANFSISALAPVFTGGQVRARVRLSEAQKREMAISYQKTIYNALREVSDALVRYDRTREQEKQEELLVQALSETSRLSNLRYRGGLDSYLQVLDAERNLFQGQLALARLRLQGILSFVEIYRALGGGWE